MKRNNSALDLFCGAGGASVGLFRAGFNEIIGIDILPQPEYPFDFMEADIMNFQGNFYEKIIRGIEGLCHGFDFIWASPPCQEYSIASLKHRNNGKTYPDLISATRQLLQRIGKPFVIENVPPAPMRKDLLLCGEMFGLRVIRHRIFEVSGFRVKQLKHKKHKGTVANGHYVTVAGNGGNSNGHNYCKLRGLEKLSKLRIWQHAMGINWITDLKMLAQAVPPAYSKHIAQQFFQNKEV